jgi:hypothetical protein
MRWVPQFSLSPFRLILQLSSAKLTPMKTSGLRQQKIVPMVVRERLSALQLVAHQLPWNALNLAATIHSHFLLRPLLPLLSD